jgi:hypothetical protein
VGAGQCVVVVEHSALKLEVFSEERHRLDLFGLLLVAGVCLGEGGNFLDEPEVGWLCNILVPVDLLLLVAPIRERFGVRPHGDFGWVVKELEEAGHGAEVLVLLAVLNLDFEKSVIMAFTLRLFNFNSGKFLVGGEPRWGDIVREEICGGDNMAEFDDISVFNREVGALVLRNWYSGKNDPVVVCIIERISGYLLA